MYSSGIAAHLHCSFGYSLLSFLSMGKLDLQKGLFAAIGILALSLSQGNTSSEGSLGTFGCIIVFVVISSAEGLIEHLDNIGCIYVHVVTRLQKGLRASW